jgi:hypothetical protein
MSRRRGRSKVRNGESDRKGPARFPAGPITLHGHRRPRLYRDPNLARRRDALSSIILPLNILGARGETPPAPRQDARPGARHGFDKGVPAPFER